MLKVLQVYRTWFPDPPGGLQEAIRQIALATRREGVETRVFALSPHPEPECLDIDGIEVFRAKSWWAPASCDLGGLTSLRSFAEQAAWADIIHYHFPWPFADFLHLLVRPDKPSIMTYHSDIVRQRWLSHLYAPLMHRMLRSMDAIVTTSPAYSITSPILSNAGIKDRVLAIPLGIDDKSYPAQEDKTAMESLGLTEDETFFLFIGVLRYYKGLHTLIQAAEFVNAKIVIAGSGPENDALNEQVKQLSLTNIIFAGQISVEMRYTLLKHCHALILPSHLRSEAYGMVLVEASMMSRPMVTCEIGTGTSFVNLDGETGFVVPPESPQRLAQAMNALLANSVQSENFGSAARLRYESLFSGPALGKAYTQVYQDVLDRQI